MRFSRAVRLVSDPCKVFGTVGSIALSMSRRRRSRNGDVLSFLSQELGATFSAFVPHTGARNSRNRFRMSSLGEELSKYSADDPRGARALSKLGVVGPELDGNSSGSPSTAGATSLASALRAPSVVV